MEKVISRKEAAFFFMHMKINCLAAYFKKKEIS